MSIIHWIIVAGSAGIVPSFYALMKKDEPPEKKRARMIFLSCYVVMIVFILVNLHRIYA